MLQISKLLPTFSDQLPCRQQINKRLNIQEIDAVVLIDIGFCLVPAGAQDVHKRRYIQQINDAVAIQVTQQPRIPCENNSADQLRRDDLAGFFGD